MQRQFLTSDLGSFLGLQGLRSRNGFRYDEAKNVKLFSYQSILLWACLEKTGCAYLQGKVITPREGTVSFCTLEKFVTWTESGPAAGCNDQGKNLSSSCNSLAFQVLLSENARTIGISREKWRYPFWLPKFWLSLTCLVIATASDSVF